MRNDGQRSGDAGALVPRSARANNGILPNSLRTLSNCLRIVSSGASTVAATVRSAASAAPGVVGRDFGTGCDRVSWAGFDKLELEGGITRRVLLLGFSYGFQVWDVEAADNVRNLVSRHDGPVSFMQMLPKPLASNQSGDKFSESRPLLIICADVSFSGDGDVQKGSGSPYNGSSNQQHYGTVNGGYVPTVVWFYSLKSHSYVHLLRFRTVVHLVRCSSRVVAVLQSTQIHCLNAATLEREYSIIVNQVPAGGLGDIGLGPLAMGPRWMAYSGSQVAVSNSGRLVPQHFSPSPSFPAAASNGSLDSIAHFAKEYAKESSKQLAAGIVTFGDMGYKKLSRYYSVHLPQGGEGQLASASVKVHGIANGHSFDADSVGMVIVRDIISKNVIAQFRAHKSPISSLCFDPSGTLLVTASVQGHNINVFRIMPGPDGVRRSSASGPAYAHLYRLQRGLTNAVIQDISFSSDSQWIMVSSSRGTSHLFAISPSGGSVNFQSADAHVSSRNYGSNSTVNGPSNSGLQMLTQQNVCLTGSPLTLSAVSRIRNGSNGWINTVSGAAAAATGRSSPLCGAIASAFHNCNVVYGNSSSLKKNYHLLVFSPSGSVMQYALRISPAFNGTSLPGATVGRESNLEYGVALMVEAIQKWNVCQKQHYKERRENINMYGEKGSTDNNKIHPERTGLDLFDSASTEKATTEEKHHMHISQSELQMHQNQNPLWARSEIYFQSFLTDSFDISKECARGGEIEIERIPIHTLEARSKGLVPVFDFVQSPTFQQGRTCVTNGVDNAQSPFEKVNGGIMDGENGLDVHQMFSETNSGTVNISGSSIEKSRFETVNTSEDETPGSCVHNRDGLEMDSEGNLQRLVMTEEKG